VGRYVVAAISARDYPVVQATVLVVAFFVVVINLVVDIVYAWLDPRIRYS
jgi:peptide/nickel transport system permease protein